MSEYAVLLSESVAEFLGIADEKAARISTEKLGFLAKDSYPGGGRGDKEKLPIDGQRDRCRLHISQAWTAFYTIIEGDTEVQVMEIVSIDGAHKRYEF